MGHKAGHDIKTRDGLERLPARAAIYWTRYKTGRYIGVRKTKTAMTWYARTYNNATREQVRHSLGEMDATLGRQFDAALERAEAWFDRADRGVEGKPITVAEACQRYVQALRDNPDKPERAADDAGGFVRRFVERDKIARIPLDKLAKGDVKDWRTRLTRQPTIPQTRGRKCRTKTSPVPPRKRSASTINRGMVCLRAALRLAMADGYVSNDHAWKQPLARIKGVSGRRDLYLTREQRQDLIDHAREDAQPFLRALAELPLRVGAVAALRVGDFDKRNKLLTIRKDKAGAGRTIPLPPAAVALIVEAARGKLPTAPLFSRWDGAPWTPTTWMDAVRCAVESADLPRETVAYTLRHCAIADLVIAGCDLNTVAKVSGTSLQMIADHYGKLRQDVARDALAALAL